MLNSPSTRAFYPSTAIRNNAFETQTLKFAPPEEVFYAVNESHTG